MFISLVCYYFFLPFKYSPSPSEYSRALTTHTATPPTSSGMDPNALLHYASLAGLYGPAGSRERLEIEAAHEQQLRDRSVLERFDRFFLIKVRNRSKLL